MNILKVIFPTASHAPFSDSMAELCDTEGKGLK